MNITILTDIPSPYQVEFFNAIDAKRYHLQVIYIYRTGKTRNWISPDIPHAHCYLDEEWKIAIDWVKNSGLVIFSSYRQRKARKLIKVRQQMCKPWVFWGERPGVNFPGTFGKIYRKFMLACLNRSDIPIWGIGRWAVKGYMEEFGTSRQYFNVPYYSNLDRFLKINRPANTGKSFRFLFSGQFIQRKGIDLLLQAFLRLQKKHDSELHLLGGGILENKLKELASDCNNVYFHGFHQWNELPQFYAEADILCAPSLYDGWGLIVPEGLAAGMPVISTDKTGAAIELIDNNNGWIIPSNNLDRLYSAMESAVSISKKKLSEMSENARQTSRKQHIDEGVKRFTEAVDGSLNARHENI